MALYGDNDGEGIPTDTLSAFNTRRSIQLRQSSESGGHRRSNGSIGGRMFHNYDIEQGNRRSSGTYGLEDLAASDSDDDEEREGVIAGPGAARGRRGTLR